MNNARAVATRLAELLHREHLAMADFLVALADFDRDRGWVALGYASLFEFLRRELGLSAGAAQYRKTASDLLNRFPEVEVPLRDGRLCLMSVCELNKVLTEENRTDVLPRFFRLSRREAQELVVEIQPMHAPHRDVLKALIPRPAPISFQPVEVPTGATSSEFAPRPASGPVTAPAAPQPATSQPLTADLSRLHITVSRRFLRKLDAARTALSHAQPAADSEAILEAGLDLVLERAAKRKGVVKRPRARRPSAAEPAHQRSTDSRHIPAAVRREVWLRDGGRCTWPLEGGGACGSTLRLELDHLLPHARGGPTTPANLRVTCAFHNREAARLAFGSEWMERWSRLPVPAAHAPPFPPPRPSG